MLLNYLRYSFILLILIPIYSAGQDKFDLHCKIKDYNYDEKTDDFYITARSPYIIIYNYLGYPIFYRNVGSTLNHFKKIKEDYYTYYDKKACFYVLDSTFTIVDTIAAKGDYSTNFHDVKFKKGKTYLIGNEYLIEDMSKLVDGGREYATITGSILQVQDEYGNVLLNWRSIDNIDILEASETFVDFTSFSIDYFHPNSIYIDDNENIYLSSRNTNQIVKIDGTTGDIIWRMGGKKNEFDLINDDTFFSGQHSIEITSDSLLYLWDNGNVYHPGYSVAKIYRIYEGSKKLELIKEIGRSVNVYAESMGNVQKDSDNNYVIGWGTNTEKLLFTEHDSTGKMVREAYIDDNEALAYAVLKMKYKNKLFYISKDTLLFDTVNYTTTKILNFSIKNNLSTKVIFNDYHLSDTNFRVLNNFPITVNSQEEVEIEVKFTPTRYGGDHEAMLVLNSYSDSTYEQKVCAFNLLKAYSEDILEPEITVIPENNSKNIDLESTITIKSDEPLRFVNDSIITVEDLKNIIELKDVSGDTVSVDFSLYINPSYDQITITPESMELNTEYCIIINDSIEDYSNNKIEKIQSCFTTKVTNAINEMTNENFIIYPNPCSDIINIRVNSDIDFIEIYNVQGVRLLKQQLGGNIKNYSINMSDFLNGLYFMKIVFDDSFFYNTKFIKN